LNVFITCDRTHDVTFLSGQIFASSLPPRGEIVLLKNFSNGQHFKTPKGERLSETESSSRSELQYYRNFIFTGSISVRLEGSKSVQLEKLFAKLEEIPPFSPKVSMLVNPEKKPDVILQVGDTKLDAHKEILVSRSKIFEAMFNTDAKENQDGVVVIQDLELKVVEEMLIFMYTDCSPNIKELAECLLPAADKYFIDKLKLICEIELIEHVSNQNVCKLSKLSETCKSENLAAFTSLYINENFQNIVKDVGWNEIQGIPKKVFKDVMKNVNISN